MYTAGKIKSVRRAKYARQSSRLYAQSLAPKFHQSNGPRLVNALLALRKNSRVLRHRRAFADCFGANPVASALGNLARRDPGGLTELTTSGLTYRSKPELSTLLQSGTFYFALTALKLSVLMAPGKSTGNSAEL
jgi:hypothetical protein